MGRNLLIYSAIQLSLYCKTIYWILTSIVLLLLSSLRLSERERRQQRVARTMAWLLTTHIIRSVPHFTLKSASCLHMDYMDRHYLKVATLIYLSIIFVIAYYKSGPGTTSPALLYYFAECPLPQWLSVSEVVPILTQSSPDLSLDRTAAVPPSHWSQNPTLTTATRSLYICRQLPVTASQYYRGHQPGEPVCQSSVSLPPNTATVSCNLISLLPSPK